MGFAAIIVLLGGIVVAHLVGWRLAHHLRVEPGHIRQVMPTLPVSPIHEGSASERWNRSLRRVERLLLGRFEKGVVGAEATRLAAELNEDPMLVDGALERIREEIPCRLRITRSGKLLHDFAAEDIASLRGKRTRSWPFRILVFGLAALANIGAVWPVVLILMIAGGTLNAVMLTATAAEGEATGMTGLGIITLVAGAAVTLGFIAKYALMPLFEAPRLGPVTEQMQTGAQQIESSSGLDGWFGTSSRRRRRGGFWYFGGWGSGSSSRSSSSSSSSSGDSDFGQAIVIIILIVIIAVCTFALYVWARGLWRALQEDDKELDRMGPEYWVRTHEPLDAFERWIPTNDLVGRLSSSIRRVHTHRRPVDADLGTRILALAARCDCKPSTLDIALQEGLDLDEAAEVGSRLCSLVDGRILVSDHGDLVFEFPPSVIDDLARDPSDADDLVFEYLETRAHQTRKRFLHADDSVPVNMVGITAGHLNAASRLVGGTWLMALSAVFFISPEVQAAGDLLPSVGPAVETGLVFLAAAFAVGTTALAAAAKYCAAATAVHGVRRDARRAAVREIRERLNTGKSTVKLDHVVNTVVNELQPAWPDIPIDTIEKEVRGVMVDFDVGPDIESGDPDLIDIGSLHDRLRSARRADDGAFSVEQVHFEGEEIVFDTEIEPDRISVLA